MTVVCYVPVVGVDGQHVPYTYAEQMSIVIALAFLRVSWLIVTSWDLTESWFMAEYHS